MTNTVQLKRSSVANSVPGAANLAPGELAINYADGNLFYKDSGNAVTVIASNKFSSVTGNVTGGNVLTGGLISAAGNITANISSFFIGNGSLLTGISGGSGASISNGTSNVTVVSSGGNVTVGVGSTGNVAVFATTGEFITGLLSVSGNITGGNFITGPGGNISGADVITANAVSASANILTGGFISATGNITGGNILGGANVDATTHTGTTVSITGNVIANNGMFTNIVNVASHTGTVVSVTGNVTANNGIFGNRVLVGSGNLSSPSIAFSADGQTDTGFYWISDGVIGIATNGSARANFNATGLDITGIMSASGNVTGGNLLTGGFISAGANVTGEYFFGNGSQLSGLAASYGNANVVANLAALGSNPVSTTGNITGGNLLTGGLISATANVTANNGMFTTIVNTASFTGAVVSVSGNITSGNIITGNGSGGNLTGANVISATTLCATGNITGGNILGGANVNATTHTGTTVSVTADVTGGNLLTGGFISAAGNITGGNILGGANVNATLHTGTTVSVTGNITSGNVNTGNITITGDLISSLGATLTIDPATVGNAGLVVINGNLQVNGTTTTINSNVVSTNDLTINFANNAINASAANGGGIEVGPIGSPFITWLYNDIANVWTSSNGISVVGNITGGNVLGGANVNATTHTGTTVSVTANVTGGNLLTGGFVSANGNIDGGNLSGTNIVGTLTTASQTNITSVGTLGSLTVTANTTSGNLLTGGFVSAIGNITANTGSFFIGNGSLLTGTGTPLTVSQYTSGNTSNAISNVSTLQFDTTTGFIVTSIGNNAALISMGSSFKTWQVTGQANLVAVGEDIVQFVAGTGISITTNAVSTPQQISFTATYGNSNVDNYLPTYTGNLISLTGPVTTTANITGGNILTGGLISATGNVTGNYFIGNGSLLSGIAASYGNANVVANLAALGTNPVSTTGNIDGGNLSGTNIVGTLITALQTNITAVGTLGSLTVTANTTSGNLLTAGLISVAGNITANTGSFFIGNGSQLTGITAVSSYGNANVVANLAALGSNPISTTGNITGNYILGNGSQLTGLATTSITTDSFTGNGSTTTFTLSTTPSSINATTVNYNGVTLLRSSYSVNVANVIFSSAPANNSNIEITTLTSGSSGSTGSSLIWNIASSNATMTASNGYFVDTSSSAKTMTLPASVTLGDTIQINDLAGTFATNNLTVARNGQNIQGVANNLVVSTNQSSFDLVYSNSTYGWKILGL